MMSDGRRVNPVQVAGPGRCNFTLAASKHEDSGVRDSLSLGRQKRGTEVDVAEIRQRSKRVMQQRAYDTAFQEAWARWPPRSREL